MDLNSDQMFLLAKIEFLQKENDALKEERVTTLQKLELAEVKENEMITHQIEVAKTIRNLDKARQDDKAKIAKIESELDSGKKLNRQQIVQQNKLQERLNDASLQMTAFKKRKAEELNEAKVKFAKLEVYHETATGELKETIENLKQKYEGLKSNVQAQNSVKMLKDPLLTEELWCKAWGSRKLNWGQNDENIFLGDVTKFRLDPAHIETAQNIHQSLAYHLNWWLKLNKTENGRQFLKQPEIINYRNDVCIAISRGFREHIRKTFKPLRKN